MDTHGFPQVNIGSEENPWFEYCVNAALKVLSRNKKGFFVMFEQGDTEWSNTLMLVTADHSNSCMRLVKTLGKGDHTNEPVTLYAFGSHAYSFTEREGKWHPGMKIIDNTHIYRVTLRPHVSLRDAGSFSWFFRLFTG